MSIIYSLTSIILFILILLVKKTEKSQNLLMWIAIGMVILLCYNTFSCYIFTMCNIPITLLTLTIENIAIIVIVSPIIFIKKKIQTYNIEKRDIGAILIIILMVILIASLQFGFPFGIKYIMTDAAAHYLAAQEFYESDCLLIKAENIQSNKCLMPGAYSNTGILFKVLAPYIGENNLYQVFIVFDLLILGLGTIIIYFIINENVKNNMKYILAIVIALIYVLGYPLNSVLAGYSYLSVCIVIIATILLFMKNFEEYNNNIFTIMTLFLLCIQVFFSYYLFVPAVYGALGVYFIFYFRKKHNKIFNCEMWIFVIITLFIPAIIGFCYQILPEITSISNIQTLENIKTEGYIYRNMVTNIILLIPFSIYYIYIQINKKDINFIIVFSGIWIVYMYLILLAMIKNMISTYYFYKLHFILWIIMWILFYKGASAIIDNINKGKIIVKIYIIIYAGLLILSLLGKNVEITKSTITHEKITDVMEIFGINKTILFYVEKDYNKEELEILDYIKENNLSMHDNNTLIIGEERQEFWFWAMLKYTFKENINYSTTINHINMWNDGTYEYLIYFNRSTYYGDYKDIMDLEGKEVVFQNESGAIVKNNK